MKRVSGDELIAESQCLLTSNNLTENYISRLTLLAISPVSSVSFLPYPIPVAFMRSHSCSPRVPLVLSFYLSRRVCSPSLCNTQYTHVHMHERSSHFFCCQSRKFGNAGARPIRAGSREPARADSLRRCSRGRRVSPLRGEIERRAEDISRGFDPRSTKVGHRRSATERISPFNGTGQDDLVTPVRATRAPRIQMRSALTRRASQFRDFLLAPVRSRRLRETPSLPPGREGSFHERKISG